MTEENRIDISEEVNPTVPAHSQPPPTHASPPPTPAGIPPASTDAPALPTTHALTVHPFTISLPSPPAPTAVPLPTAAFLTSDQVLSAPPPVSMPAPAAVYTPPPTIFPAPSVPAPVHPQVVEPPLYPSLQTHTNLPYQAPPPINTTYLEPGTPTHAPHFASPTHFFLEADAEQKRRLKRMEETIRALQANETRPNASYGDGSLFPSMQFKTYEGTTDPRHHLRHYRGKMLQYWDYEEFVIHSFQDSLAGSALDWFMSLKAEDIPTWVDLSRKFIDQYKYCVEMPSTQLELSTNEMAQGQKFEDYAAKWRAHAAKHIPPISEVQQIQLFHSTLQGVYYSHLLANTSLFSDLIEAGKKLDMGIKLGRMEGPAGKGEGEPSKRTTVGVPSRGGRKGKETAVNVVNLGHPGAQHYSVNLTPAPTAVPAYFPPPPQHQPQSIYYSAPPVLPPMTSQPFVHHYTPAPTPSPQPRPSYITYYSVLRAPPPAQQGPASQGPQVGAAQYRSRKQYTPLPAPLSHIYQQLLAGDQI
ncbi:hypothetical protein CRG98_006382 [Punica granatum]|uniref:Retrotransposon gag domain-containing protein n=1 Tax=Punica granatum TaxID=22663 RepID=A0A2I0KXR7_PUNGR|nr:hypothetical protein CRG98_006382 [Punica granatum]